MFARSQTLFHLERPRHWLTRLIQSTLVAFPITSPRPTERTLQKFIVAETLIEKEERGKGQIKLTPIRPSWAASMQPADGPPSRWQIPAITSIPELANWLGIETGELDWFADRHLWGNECDGSPACHYRRRWIPKTSGGVRLLEAPKARLMQIQRRILHGILDVVPVHGASHAYRSGRSVASYVAPHAGNEVILHIDLREFFPSIRASQVHATFRTLGYPERIASLLTGLVTCSTPSNILERGLQRTSREWIWDRYRSAHLPQGAPTSPALANLCAHRLDARLSGLARVASAQYTRYADDIVFSGDHQLRQSLPRLRVLIHAIILDEGFDIRLRKTQVMVRGSSQQVSGIKLNHHPNIPRATFDELKAILHNCVKRGPESQNRDGQPRFRDHLAGRLAYWSSICPERIAKLRKIFDRIEWPA